MPVHPRQPPSATWQAASSVSHVKNQISAAPNKSPVSPSKTNLLGRATCHRPVLPPPQLDAPDNPRRSLSVRSLQAASMRATHAPCAAGRAGSPPHPHTLTSSALTPAGNKRSGSTPGSDGRPPDCRAAAASSTRCMEIGECV
eukprot:215905-Chlamydomonas_euryale.AAC.2